MMRSSVVFPQPLGPSSGHEGSRLDRHRDVIQHRQSCAARVLETVRDVANLDHGPPTLCIQGAMRRSSARRPALAITPVPARITTPTNTRVVSYCEPA